MAKGHITYVNYADEQPELGMDILVRREGIFEIHHEVNHATMGLLKVYYKVSPDLQWVQLT